MFLRSVLKSTSKYAVQQKALYTTPSFFRFSDSIDPQSIYARIGGQPAMNLAVNNFYDKVLADPKVNFFFKNTDMKLQRERQEQFLTMAFGGPNKYEGTDMVTAHKGMNITEEQYDVIVNHLATTLAELSVPESIIGEIAGIADSVRGDIVGK